MFDRIQLRALGRDASLIFCAAVAAYLVGAWLAARVAPALAGVLGDRGPVLRVVVGVLALDLVRAPGLLGVAWLLGPLIAARPAYAAAAVVLLSYACDAAVAALLQQFAWLWGEPAVLLCRAAAAALLIWLVRLVLRRRASAADPPASGQ